MYAALIIGVILTLAVLVDHQRFKTTKRKAQGNTVRGVTVHQRVGEPVRQRVIWFLGVCGAFLIGLGIACIAGLDRMSASGEIVPIIILAAALLGLGLWLVAYYFNTSTIVTRELVQHTTFLRNTKTLRFQDIAKYQVGYSRGGQFVVLHGIDRTKNGARIKIVYTPDEHHCQPLFDAIAVFERTGSWPSPGGPAQHQ
ncbi:hypothetical protein V5R04_02915 [Jonesiaceae bacterium BS-20]|uniref:PH domain-containing protein n=1 Tax=Jonesiaceae bacterium BS-20 TaxID=3120821 RepID=A0AAU7DXI2_9MICO